MAIYLASIDLNAGAPSSVTTKGIRNIEVTTAGDITTQGSVTIVTDLDVDGATTLDATTIDGAFDATAGLDVTGSNLTLESINLAWVTDGSGDIGGAADNRPDNVYAKTSLQVGSDTWLNEILLRLPSNVASVSSAGGDVFYRSDTGRIYFYSDIPSADVILLDNTNSSIKELNDVNDAMAPNDGELLTWDNGNNRWDSASITPPRLLWMANTTTYAELQAALNNAAYDGVSLEGGAAIAITADLTIPAGKILEGAYKGADLDWPGMAILDLDADFSVLIGDGELHHLAIEQDAASTVSAVIGLWGAIAEYVRVYTSDGAFHNEWAFDSGFQVIRHCVVLGLKGILSQGSDTSGGTVEISGNYIDCVSVTGFTARGIEINQSNVNCYNNRVHRGGYGFHLTSSATHSFVYGCYASACTDSGFYSYGATFISIDNCYSIDNVNGFEFLGNCINWSVGSLYSSENTVNGFILSAFWDAEIVSLFSDNDAGVGIDIRSSATINIGSLFSYRSSGHGVYLQSNTDFTINSITGNDCNGTACVYIDSANSRLTIETIMARSSTAEGVYVGGSDTNIGSIFSSSNTREGVTVRGVDINIGKIYALLNTMAGVSLGHNGVLTRGSIGDIESTDNQQQGVELGPSLVSDFRVGSIHAFSNIADGLREVAAGDADGVTIASITARENGAYGINLKSTAARNWIRNIIAEGNTTSQQVILSSGWLSGEPYAQLYFSTPAATVITVGGTFQKAAGTTTLTNSEDFTLPSNNNAAYTSGTPVNRLRKFTVAYHGDIESSVAELVQIGIRDVTSGVTILDSIVGVDIVHTNDRIPISCSGVVTLNDASAIEVWVTATSNGTNVTVRGGVSVEVKPSTQ